MMPDKAPENLGAALTLGFKKNLCAVTANLNKHHFNWKKQLLLSKNICFSENKQINYVAHEYNRNRAGRFFKTQQVLLDQEEQNYCSFVDSIPERFDKMFKLKGEKYEPKSSL